MLLWVSMVSALQSTANPTTDPMPHAVLSTRAVKQAHDPLTSSIANMRSMRATMEHLARVKARMERISDAKKDCTMSA
jgi:hypothetical protein